jgi:hypothetical protein
VDGYTAPRGPSIIDRLYRELETADGEYARGLAVALAILLNPYDPDPDAVLRQAEENALI